MKQGIKLGVFLIFIFLFLTSNSIAIIIRHDISEDKYLVKTSPEYLVDLPHEGHAVLIHPQWLVTVAHTIFYDYRGKILTIAGKKYEISQVISHPDYRKPARDLAQQKDTGQLMKYLASNKDIALIKLKSPVTEATPISLYKKHHELGKKIEIYGKGATGNGLKGEKIDTKEQKLLRFCRNIITATKSKWLIYQFDFTDTALPLEGMHGSGDSGGPSITYINNIPYLVGLSSWQFWEGEISKFKGGLYGRAAYQVRISHYADWIESTINNN